MLDLKGHTAIITGAAGNLGRATAAALSARGARLALVDRDADRLEAAREAASSQDNEAHGFVADLLDPQSVAAMVDAVSSRLGQFDILANIAGGFAMGPPVHETTDAEWQRMLDLNLRSVFNCTRAAIPGMLELGNGRIINVAARAATRGIATMAPYCVAKAAVITLTESLAEELKHEGITVNCVLPGTLDTPENRAAMPDQDHSTWVSLEALADVIAFLASDASRAITGAAIPVYGRS